MLNIVAAGPLPLDKQSNGRVCDVQGNHAWVAISIAFPFNHFFILNFLKPNIIITESTNCFRKKFYCLLVHLTKKVIYIFLGFAYE